MLVFVFLVFVLFVCWLVLGLCFFFFSRFFLVLYLNCMLCAHNAKLPWLSLVLQAMGKRGEKDLPGLP